MIISWLGQACITIKNKEGKVLVIDPYDSSIGIAMPAISADAVLVTHSHHDHNNVQSVGGKPFIIQEQGEYEAGGFFVETVASFHDDKEGKERGTNLIFIVSVDGYRVAHFGDFGQRELTPAQLEALGQIDIACIPVGGFYTIDGAGAAKLVHQFEPKIAIPIHYQIPGLAVKELASPEAFFGSLGMQAETGKDLWNVKATDFPQEGTQVIQLKPLYAKI